MEDDRTILLVEDSPDDVELILRSLKKHNIRNEVTVKSDGAEALDWLLSAETLPTVVLLDLKLPKIDGLEVLERIRTDERTKLLPVVILTSSKEQEDRLESYRLGANSFVRKPIDFAEFSEAINQLGLYWLLLNEPPPKKGEV